MYHWHNHNWQLVQTQQWSPGSWSRVVMEENQSGDTLQKPLPLHPHRVSFPPTLYNTKTKRTYWVVPPSQNKDAEWCYLSSAHCPYGQRKKLRWVLGMIAGYYKLWEGSDFNCDFHFRYGSREHRYSIASCMLYASYWLRSHFLYLY